jgi:hypothetical protein
VVLAAFVILAAMQLMGVILLAAMLVVPVTTAGHVAPSFRASIVLAELATISGMTPSYTHDVAASGAIVLVNFTTPIYRVLSSSTSSLLRELFRCAVWRCWWIRSGRRSMPQSGQVQVVVTVLGFDACS